MDVLTKVALNSDGVMRFSGLAGVLVAVYLAIMGLNSLLFSFRYAVYSIFCAGVILIAELPSLFNCGPLAKVAAYINPLVKSGIYGVLCLGGISYFINYSWNPLLLAGHLATGALAYQTWKASKSAPPPGYDQVSQTMEDL
mmetsp:Transcript_73931/g.175960  ORF Transcript_73931/g.175960 Transcript_73931/m.175960 type:complete len:141 (+) Transcript_73931:87-509(+)